MKRKLCIALLILCFSQPVFASKAPEVDEYLLLLPNGSVVHSSPQEEEVTIDELMNTAFPDMAANYPIEDVRQQIAKVWQEASGSDGVQLLLLDTLDEDKLAVASSFKGRPVICYSREQLKHLIIGYVKSEGANWYACFEDKLAVYLIGCYYTIQNSQKWDEHNVAEVDRLAETWAYACEHALVPILDNGRGTKSWEDALAKFYCQLKENGDFEQEWQKFWRCKKDDVPYSYRPSTRSLGNE